MINTFEMDGKRYILLSDDSVELFDNWLVGYNLRLAEETKRLTKRALDFAPRCPKCNAITGWHHEACEDYSPETQSQ